MSGPTRIEAYAIISEDGMLADAEGRIPDALKVKADQEFFHAGLDRAAAVVHGRHSHEGPPDAARRYRLIATRTIAGIACDPARPRTLFWNPQGASLEAAWSALSPPAGRLAVIGGTDVYAYFLTRGFDAFHLSRVPHLRLPGGRPVFPAIGPGRTPEDVLREHALKPGPQQVLDAGLGVTLVSWKRAPASSKG
jgi:dihydrofolate reductase